MDILKINWTERAHNDPVVNYLFRDYIFEKDHLKQETKTPVIVKDKPKSQKQPSSTPESNIKKENLNNHPDKKKKAPSSTLKISKAK